MTARKLSARERQIMDVIYRLGHGTVSEVHEALDDPPSRTSVRTTLRILEEKGHLFHEQDGPRYVYRPTVPAEEARSSVLKNVVETFFSGSPEQTVAALIDLSGPELSAEQLDRLSRLIDEARKEGR